MKCSFCSKFITDEHVLIDLNNNKYCKACAQVKIFKWSDEDMEKLNERMRRLL